MMRKCIEKGKIRQLVVWFGGRGGSLLVHNIYDLTVNIQATTDDPCTMYHVPCIPCTMYRVPCILEPQGQPSKRPESPMRARLDLWATASSSDLRSVLMLHV